MRLFSVTLASRDTFCLRMPHESDWDLLERYAQHRDETAFAEVVRRHMNLVFSAALRRVGSRQNAQDVTQAVFVILARKAKSMRRDRPVSGWLLTTVRYAAANFCRIESARRRHEAGAAVLRSEISTGAGACSTNPSDVLIWQELSGRVDDAVLKLPDIDRRAILLRYFEQRPIREIADALKVSEAAAKQRISRALDKLRGRLTRYGAADLSALGANGFETLLRMQAVRAAPAGLVGHAVAAAVGAPAGGVMGVMIAKGAMKMMAWTKIKVAAGVLGVVVIGGAGGAISVARALAQDGGHHESSANIAPSAVAASVIAPSIARSVGAAPARPMATPPAHKPEEKKEDDHGPSLENAPPVILRTIPQSGVANVDPALAEIRVTYSKEMTDHSWSWSTWGENTSPKITGKPHYLDGKRTCVLPVKLQPGHFYAFWLNSNNFSGFQDKNGHKAVPYLLVFKTRP